MTPIIESKTGIHIGWLFRVAPPGVRWIEVPIDRGRRLVLPVEERPVDGRQRRCLVVKDVASLEMLDPAAYELLANRPNK